MYINKTLTNQSLVSYHYSLLVIEIHFKSYATIIRGVNMIELNDRVETTGPTCPDLNSTQYGQEDEPIFWGSYYY